LRYTAEDGHTGGEAGGAAAVTSVAKEYLDLKGPRGIKAIWENEDRGETVARKETGATRATRATRVTRATRAIAARKAHKETGVFKG